MAAVARLDRRIRLSEQGAARRAVQTTIEAANGRVPVGAVSAPNPGVAMGNFHGAKAISAV
jgi:hypothetical protein